MVEALYCGIPIVSTDCPNGPREILADGKYGHLIPIDNVISLAQAIIAAIIGEISRTSADGWRPYELKTIVDEYINVLFV